jgi:hypothetical protein
LIKDYAECLTRLDTLRRMTHDACLKKNWNDVRECAEKINDVALDLIHIAGFQLDLIDLARFHMDETNG